MSAPAFRLILAQLLDAVTFLAFYVFIGAGTYVERNPIVLVLMAIGGIWFVAFVKVAIAAGAARRFDRQTVTARWYRPTATILLAVATASGIAGAGFNVAAILRSVSSG